MIIHLLFTYNYFIPALILNPASPSVTSDSNSFSNSKQIGTPGPRSSSSLSGLFNVGDMDQTPALSNQPNVLEPLKSSANSASKSAFENSTKTFPRSIQKTLLEWYEHGREDPPPCVMYGGNRDPNFSTKSQQPAQWTQSSGNQPLKIQSIKWKRDIPGKRKTFWLLTATSSDSAPFIIKYKPGERTAVGGLRYAVWLGVEGNQRGFENVPSVLKYVVDSEQGPNTATSCEPEASPDQPKRKASEDLGVRQDVKMRRSEPDNKNLSRLLTLDNGRSALPASSIGKDFKRAIVELDEVVSSAISVPSVPAHSERKISIDRTEATTALEPSERAEPAISLRGTRGPDPSELENHILENTFLHFHKDDTSAPRKRSLAFCKGRTAEDCMHRLFAHATAGKLFSNADRSRLLLQLMIEGVDEPLFAMYQEEEDFEQFKGALREAPCWDISDDGIEGQCVVEVRAATLG